MCFVCPIPETGLHEYDKVLPYVTETVYIAGEVREQMSLLLMTGLFIAITGKDMSFHPLQSVDWIHPFNGTAVQVWDRSIQSQSLLVIRLFIHVEIKVTSYQ